MELELIRHPASPPSAIDTVRVRVSHESGTRLALTFMLSGDIGALAVSAPAAPAERVDGLWQATCFEAFVKVPGQDGYAEFNFAPSTQWAAYLFDGYRTGRRDLSGVAAPRFDMRAGTDMFELGVVFHAAEPPDANAGAAGDRLLGLSAVLEMRDRSKSYWALAHPDPAKPDFHHEDCFAALLQAPGTA